MSTDEKQMYLPTICLRLALLLPAAFVIGGPFGLDKVWHLQLHQPNALLIAIRVILFTTPLLFALTYLFPQRSKLKAAISFGILTLLLAPCAFFTLLVEPVECIESSRHHFDWFDVVSCDGPIDLKNTGPWHSWIEVQIPLLGPVMLCKHLDDIKQDPALPTTGRIYCAEQVDLLKVEVFAETGSGGDVRTVRDAYGRKYSILF